MNAAHKAAPTRRQIRRRNTWMRRGSILMLVTLLAGACAGIVVNGVNPVAYGAAQPFQQVERVTLGTGGASRSQTREPLSDTDGQTVDGEWSLDGSSTLDADKLVGWQSDNPVVMELLNGRDKDSVPAGFDPDHATGDTDGNAYPFSECTWWAYVRRHQLGLPAGSYMGNGNQWADSARRLGYWVDSTPRQGDVMVFQSGQAGSSLIYGHVAIVEQVNEDGSIVTSECGAAYNGQPFSRTFPASEVGDYQYIHY